MAGDSPISWFEIPATDLERAQAFYERILDLQMARFAEGAFRMAWFTSPGDATGPAGALMESPRYVPSHDGTMIYFDVEDIDAVLQRVAAAGGTVLTGKVGIGEHGFVGHFEDTEGNRVGLRTRS